MIRIFIHLLAFMGSLAVFCWVLSQALFGDNPVGPAGRFAGGMDMLITGLICMVFALVLAVLTGRGFSSNSGKSARKLRLVVDNK